LDIENVMNAFVGLIITALLAFVCIGILIPLSNAFEPLIGGYSREIFATAVAAVIGSVAIAGYVLKKAVSG